MRLRDQVAIVTGGGQGLGRRYAHRFAQEGAAVAVADLNGEQALAVAAEIRAGGGWALGVTVDVADPASVSALAEQVLSEFGRVDILVNNAAIFSTIQMKPFEEISLTEWRRVMAVNVDGTFLCCQAVVPAMRKQGRGKIVNISSSTVPMGRPWYLHYVTSKAAVVGLTRALAREVGDDAITVNCVMPGATVTEVPRETVNPEQMRAMVNARCIKREQVPEDLEGIVLFLASAESDFISGQTVIVDGGLAMQ